MDRTARQLVTILHELLDVDELDEILRRVLAAARELTDARRGALGVLDSARDELDLFFTAGLQDAADEATLEVALRQWVVDGGPGREGSGLPVVASFLASPIVIRGEVYGTIFLVEKEAGGDFDEADEMLLAVLAGYAAIGILHFRRLDHLEDRRDELERTVAALAAIGEVSRALAGEVDLEPILELVAERGRALVEARALVILLPGHDGLRVSHAAGEIPRGLVGRTAAESSVVANVMASRHVRRVADLDRSDADPVGLGATSGLFVPLAFRGRAVGILMACDRLSGGPQFTRADADLLTSFATTAAAAVGAAQALSAARQRERSAAAEAERRRWARELHDETLQGIAAVRVLLASSRRSHDAELRETIAHAETALQGEVDRLRDIIHDVRPSSLDDLGLAAAMEALVVRHTHDGGPALVLEVDLDHEAGRAPERPHPDVETAIYRIAQEALTNALKHAGAHAVEITVAEIDGEIGVRVRDDGRGYDARESTDGFGLVSIRERVELLGGRVRVVSAPGRGHNARGADSRPGRPLIIADNYAVRQACSRPGA